jgi:hypothetical protein
MSRRDELDRLARPPPTEQHDERAFKAHILFARHLVDFGHIVVIENLEIIDGDLLHLGLLLFDLATHGWRGGGRREGREERNESNSLKEQKGYRSEKTTS